MLFDWFRLDLTAISDPLDRRQAPLVQRMLLSIFGVALAALPVTALSPNRTGSLVGYATLVTAIVFTAVALGVLRRGAVRPAAAIGACGVVLGLQPVLMGHGLRSGIAPIICYALPITVAGLVAGRRLLLLVFGLTMAALAGTAVVAQVAPHWVGFLSITGDQTASLISTAALILGAIVLLLDRFGNSLREAIAAAEANQQVADRARRHAEEQAAHLAEKTAQLERTEQYLRELVGTLEAPAVTLADGVLLTPIVGALDRARIQLLTGRLLRQVANQRARRIVIDIAGVAVVDTDVAQALLGMATAIKLLGCDVTLTGISASVAATVARLGVSFDGITIARSPQDVLEMQLA